MPHSPVQVAREAGLAADQFYMEDLYGWSVRQTEALRRRDLEALDWENIAEEIESLGSKQRDTWVSLCGKVIEHMLKIEHCEGDEHLAHWQAEIEDWRSQMARNLKANPSLTGRYGGIFGLAWEQGRDDAVRSITASAGHTRQSKAWRDEKHRIEAMLPEACPYRLLEVTACNTEERRPSVHGEIMPPSVAAILNERAGAEYPVRPWPGLDFRLRVGSRALGGPGISR